MKRVGRTPCVSRPQQATQFLFRPQYLPRIRRPQKQQHRWISRGHAQRQHAAPSMEAMRAEYAKRNSSTLYALRSKEWLRSDGGTDTMELVQVSRHWLLHMEVCQCTRWLVILSQSHFNLNLTVVDMSANWMERSTCQGSRFW